MVRNSLLTCLLLLGLYGCSVLNQKDSSTIISTQYQLEDLVSVKILFTDILSCTDFERSYLSIESFRNRSQVHYIDFCRDYEVRSILDTNLLPTIQQFETEAKGIGISCGGYSGGHGVRVEMKVNDEKSEFSYCQSYGEPRSALFKLIDGISLP